MTVIPFQPSTSAPFQFQATLDDEIYTIIVKWNLSGQRFYVNCYDLAGVRIFSLPLIGSPADYPINIAGGYFVTSTLVFVQPDQQFIVTP